MALIDRQGRVFGRINVIDALAVLFAIALVPVMLVAYRAFRERPVTIAAVTPTRVFVGSAVRIHVSGAEFKPYMQAFVSKAGTPFTMEGVDRSRLMGSYLLASPSQVELEFPELEPATYDLYLSDHGRVIVSRPSAFTVGQPDYPKGVRTMKVQFYPPPEALPLITPGDTDIYEPRLPGLLVGEPAVVTAVEPKHVTREVVDMRLTAKQDAWIGQPMMGELVEVTLRLPVLETQPGRWAYGEDSIRVGNVFMLSTAKYRLHGVITFLGPVEPVEKPRS